MKAWNEIEISKTIRWKMKNIWIQKIPKTEHVVTKKTKTLTLDFNTVDWKIIIIIKNQKSKNQKMNPKTKKSEKDFAIFFSFFGGFFFFF